MTLTLEQVLELRRLAEAGKTSRQVFEERFLGDWSALLDAAERVARQEIYKNEPDGYDSPELADLIARGKLTSRNTYAEALAEDDAAFARNELAAGEWLAEVDAAHPNLHWQNDFATARDIGMADPKAYADADTYGKRAMLDRFKAERRAAELEAECLTEFHMRPCMERGSHSVNPHAFGPEHVEAWYRSRGVIVQVEPGPDPGRLNIKPLRMVR